MFKKLFLSLILFFSFSSVSSAYIETNITETQTYTSDFGITFQISGSNYYVYGPDNSLLSSGTSSNNIFFITEGAKYGLILKNNCSYSGYRYGSSDGTVFPLYTNTGTSCDYYVNFDNNILTTGSSIGGGYRIFTYVDETHTDYIGNQNNTSGFSPNETFYHHSFSDNPGYYVLDFLGVPPGKQVIDDISDLCLNVEYLDSYAYTPITNLNPISCLYEDNFWTIGSYKCSFNNFSYELSMSNGYEEDYYEILTNDVLFNNTQKSLYDNSSTIKFTFNGDQNIDYIRFKKLNGTSPDYSGVLKTVTIQSNLDSTFKNTKTWDFEKSGEYINISNLGDFTINYNNIDFDYIEVGQRFSEKSLIEVCNGPPDLQNFDNLNLTGDRLLQDINESQNSYISKMIDGLLKDENGEYKDNFFFSSIKFITPYLPLEEPDFTFKYPFPTLTANGSSLSIDFIMVDGIAPKLEDFYGISSHQRTESGIKFILVILGILFIISLYLIFGIYVFLFYFIFNKGLNLLNLFSFRIINGKKGHYSGNVASLTVFVYIIGLFFTIASFLYASFLSQIFIPLGFSKEILIFIFSYIAVFIGDYSFFALFINSLFSVLITIFIGYFLIFGSIKFGKLN